MKITSKKFREDQNHAITGLEGADFIRNFRALPNPYKTTGGYFDRQAIKALIDQSGAVGLRYYYGLTEDTRKALVLVGTDADRQDLLNGEPVKRSVFNPAFDRNGEYDPAQIDHRIALEDAAKLTATYRNLQSPEQVKGGFFGKRALHEILTQEDCVGIRFIFGAKEDGTPVMVLVGVEKFGADLFFGRLMELTTVCPPACGYDTILNSGPINASERASNADHKVEDLADA